MKQELICPFCGRVCKNNSGYLNHVKHCKHNPDRIIKVVSDETKQKLSEGVKKLWEDPEYRQKTIVATKKAMEDPKVKQKLSDAKKGKKLTDEHKQKLSDAGKGRKLTDEHKQKISETNKIVQNSPETKQKHIEAANKPEVRQKEYETKKKNNSFNTSKIEVQLKEWFISQNIDFKTQYKSDLYPFMCDFYLPKYDLYIEIQGSWTHGGKPYNETDTDCIKQLENWKSKNSKFYDNAIETWTMRDVKKRETAKANNLNWIEIFSIDLEECINIIQTHYKD